MPRYLPVILVSLFVITNLTLGIYWSQEPDLFDVHTQAKNRARTDNSKQVIGYTTTITLIETVNTLLYKPGGYLSNDVIPPSIVLDNIPNWEFGVLVQVRDLARALRNNFSRSQTQSTADPDLEIAEPLLNFDSESWLFPPTESEYADAVKALERYLTRLSDSQQKEAQFYARADNLREWLKLVETRLGALSQRLSASVGQIRIDTDLAGDTAATQATETPEQIVIKTPWLEIDDVFFEARGTTWALIHFLKAVEHDFASVLEKKNARISLQQIIRELEGSQRTVWSPMIMNGSGFGMFANHSLVMASYISRANAALIDLRNLLAQG